MKRRSLSSQSLGDALLANGEEERSIYGGRSGFQVPMHVDVLDQDDDCGGGEDELCSIGSMHGGSEKKRRLSPDQVRALERSFELENKLEPDRKLRLAQDLGLQPRQVAVWFQNRRARWKTKQLERDFAALRSSYDSLKLDFDSLRHENHLLLSDIKELKRKLEEPLISKESSPAPLLIFKDGSPDSTDSSAVLMNEKRKDDDQQQQGNYDQEQLMRLEEMEEQGFDEPCSSFFNDEQAPTLSWYCSEWC
ncbi:hypothetical protein J5N97_009671 [Dioscorea zingiberensis]|uniref:Homeobox-leucine zipper protein n=1 Tax=Dioscorea zingiberensis TaxID=325984 RepID=A0A9D5CXL1_9LILI|nr:hypothetical protein J5N97_009671 [Dioscorea zingiberensis]